MALTPKVLAEGYLPTSEGVLYTVPSGTTTSLSEINLHNINAADQTVIVSARTNSISRIFGQLLLKQGYSARRGPGLILEVGDTLRGYTTTANAVHYTIMGVEQS